MMISISIEFSRLRIRTIQKRARSEKETLVKSSREMLINKLLFVGSIAHSIQQTSLGIIINALCNSLVDKASINNQFIEFKSSVAWLKK